MISLSNVHKRFGATTAVAGVSLDVARGQVVGLLGPNGAGKTTTARMIVGAVPPTRGRVTVDGLDATDDSARVRRRLGYLPEANPLYLEMTVRGYLSFRATIHGVARRRRAAAIDGAIEACHLRDVQRRVIGKLSKGFRQRVGLAAALVHDPPVLILDEPTSGLDPEQVAQTRSLIQEMAGERTLLLISHILSEVERTCDRVVVFAGGRIRLDLSVEDALDRLANSPIVVEVAGDRVNRAAQLLGELDGVRAVAIADRADPWATLTVTPRPGADPRPRIPIALLEGGVPMRELRRDAQTLESLYLEVIRDPDAQEDPS